MNPPRNDKAGSPLKLKEKEEKKILTIGNEVSKGHTLKRITALKLRVNVRLPVHHSVSLVHSWKRCYPRGGKKGKEGGGGGSRVPSLCRHTSSPLFYHREPPSRGLGRHWSRPWNQRKKFLDLSIFDFTWLDLSLLDNSRLILRCGLRFRFFWQRDGSEDAHKNVAKFGDVSRCGCSPAKNGKWQQERNKRSSIQWCESCSSFLCVVSCESWWSSCPWPWPWAWSQGWRQPYLI